MDFHLTVNRRKPGGVGGQFIFAVGNGIELIVALFIRFRFDDAGRTCRI